MRTGKFSHRLLSELICRKDSQRLGTGIYFGRIADMRVNDMNVLPEAIRQIRRCFIARTFISELT